MRQLVWIVLFLFLAGCAATPEQMTAYYQAIEKQNAALVALAREGDARIATARTQQAVGFTSAMIRAATTPEKTDDVVIAFAYGYESARPMSYSLPDLKTPAAPVTDVDRVRAWTPIVGLITPLVYPLAYGWGSSGSGGDSYQATDNGRITIASQNPGSYNKAGGDVITTNDPDNSTCVGCGTDPEVDTGLEVNPVDVDPEDPTEAPESCGTSGGWYNNGTWWLSEGSTCSCSSREAGRC